MHRLQHCLSILHLQIISLGFLTKLFITFLIFRIDCTVTAADMSKYQGYLENHPSQQLFKAFIAFILQPLHVSAFTGHHQSEHTM
jgi:hypothetical protein